MQKLILVINGRGGVGKDTLCDFAARHFKVRNQSTIDPVKALARQCGWAGEKTDRARRFLSDFKALLVAYNDYPTAWATEQYKAFLAGDEEIMFMHIREAAEIEKFIRATDGRAKALLIRRPTLLAHTYGNASDDAVENYAYDYVYENCLPIEKAEEDFVAFLRRIYTDIKE